MDEACKGLGALDIDQDRHEHRGYIKAHLAIGSVGVHHIAHISKNRMVLLVRHGRPVPSVFDQGVDEGAHAAVAETDKVLVVLGVAVLSQDLADPQPAIVPLVGDQHRRGLALVVQRPPVQLSQAHERPQAAGILGR